MKTAAFIICLAFTSAAYGGKCQNLARKILPAAKLTLQAAVVMPFVAHTVGRLMLMPQRELAVRPGIEVVGSLISSRKTGEQIAQNLEDFDRAMNDIGLKKTTLTKIIVSDRTILPSLIGPAQILTKSLNLWRKSEADDIILLQPALYFRKTVTNPPTLFHERTHSILRGIYDKNSYVLHNNAIQEGLADFLTVHYTGNPKLDIKIMGVVRNSTLPGTLPPPASGDPHKMGQVFSYVLWKLRERMGKEETTAFLKPFFDGLNQYHESFEKKHNYETIEKTIEKGFSPNYEYFMAVLKKTLQEKGEIQEADEFIDKMATELKLDIAIIDDIARTITKNDKNFYNTSTNKYLPAPLLYFLGTAAIAIEGFLLYAFLF